jgi:hypothetical protein
MPTNEKIKIGGSQGIIPLFPMLNHNADDVSPATMQVANFFRKDFESIFSFCLSEANNKFL